MENFSSNIPAINSVPENKQCPVSSVTCSFPTSQLFTVNSYLSSQEYKSTFGPSMFKVEFKVFKRTIKSLYFRISIFKCAFFKFSSVLKKFQ